MSNLNDIHYNNNLTKDTVQLFSKLLNSLPLSLYSAAILEAIFFSDIRGLLIFIGCLFNEIMIFIISLFSNNPSGDRISRCNVFKTGKTSISGSYGIPSSYMQRIGFFAGFILTYNIYYKKYNPLIFSCVVFILLGLSFNLIVQNCANIVEIVGGLFIGIIVGFIYFMMIKNYYKENLSYSNDDDFVCETVEVDS